MRARQVARRLRRRLTPVPWLSAVWVLLWGTWSWGNLAAGVLVACVITTALPLPRVSLGGRVNPVGLAHFATRFVRDLLVSSAQVAWWAVGPWDRRYNAVVAIELSTRSDLLMTITAEALTLVPGSIVIEVDRATATLYAHVLGVRDRDDVEAFRQDVLDLEARVARAFAGRAKGFSARPVAAPAAALTRSERP